MPLYKILTDGQTLEKVERKDFSNEQELHSLIEDNLPNMLGIRLIANEFSIPNGRIDTLGLDEDGIPIIIDSLRMNIPFSIAMRHEFLHIDKSICQANNKAHHTIAGQQSYFRCPINTASPTSSYRMQLGNSCDGRRWTGRYSWLSGR